MNRGELKTLIRDYTHRDAQNEPDSLLETWIDFTTARIGRDLRSWTNCKTVDFTPTGRVSSLPADFRAMEHLLRSLENGGTLKLQAGAGLTRALPNSGDACYYNLRSGNEIEIIPYVAGTYAMTYFFEPTALSSDSSENATLTQWPMLYVYGVMLESAAREQDGDLFRGAVQIWDEEVRRCNSGHQRMLEGMAVEMG